MDWKHVVVVTHVSSRGGDVVAFDGVEQTWNAVAPWERDSYHNEL
jgi:hypothetical protein